jgi:hypothetical protein
VDRSHSRAGVRRLPVLGQHQRSSRLRRLLGEVRSRGVGGLTLRYVPLSLVLWQVAELAKSSLSWVPQWVPAAVIYATVLLYFVLAASAWRRRPLHRRVLSLLDQPDMVRRESFSACLGQPSPVLSNLPDRSFDIVRRKPHLLRRPLGPVQELSEVGDLGRLESFEDHNVTFTHYYELVTSLKT